MEHSGGGQVYFISEVQPATGKLKYKLFSKNESSKQLKETAIRHNCAESESVKSVPRLTQIR